MKEPAYQNKQLYCECQLVSIWNAARFWGLDRLVPKMGTKKYRTICKNACAMSGACIDTDFEMVRLELKWFKIEWRLETIALFLPCEMSVFCERGYHSVLAVAYKRGATGKPWTNKLLMLNWKKYEQAWLGWGQVLTSANLRVAPRLIAPPRVVDNLKACQPNIVGKF